MAAPKTTVQEDLGAHLDGTPLTHTIFYSHKVPTKVPYANKEFSFFCQFNGDPINDPERFEANARAAALLVKTVVESELGNKVVLDSDGLIHSAFEDTFEGVTEVKKGGGGSKSGGASTGGGDGAPGKLLRSFESPDDRPDIEVRDTKYGVKYICDLPDGRIFANPPKWHREDERSDGDVILDDLDFEACWKQIEYARKNKKK